MPSGFLLKLWNEEAGCFPRHEVVMEREERHVVQVRGNQHSAVAAPNRRGGPASAHRRVGGRHPLRQLAARAHHPKLPGPLHPRRPDRHPRCAFPLPCRLSPLVRQRPSPPPPCPFTALCSPSRSSLLIHLHFLPLRVHPSCPRTCMPCGWCEVQRRSAAGLGLPRSPCIVSQKIGAASAC